MTNIIWTSHLQDRARERGIDPRHVDLAIRFPNKVEKSRTTNSQKHIKLIGNKLVIASVKKHGNDWVVTSVWQKPNQGRIVYSQPLIYRLLYRFVLWLEKGIRRSLKF